MKSATHFIATYDVPYINVGMALRGNREIKIDHCSSGVREIKYLEPFLKSVKKELVAVFYITPKNIM